MRLQTLECGGLAPLWPRSRTIDNKARQAAALQGGILFYRRPLSN